MGICSFSSSIISCYNSSYDSYKEEESSLKDIDLGTGRVIKISNSIINKRDLTIKNIESKINELKKLGVQVLVTSRAFGVDDMSDEIMVAEVISSIGVALSMIRESVERVIPNPTPQDVKNIRSEVMTRVIENGADPSSVDIHIEIDNTTSKLIAIATGAAEVKAMDLLKECTEEEAKELAAKDMNVDIKDVNLKDKTNNFYVFDAEIKGKELIRILDKKGFIKVQRNNGTVVKVKVKQYQEVVKNIYEYLTVYKADSVLRPDFYLCVGPRIMDFDSGTELKQNLMLMDLIVQDAQEDDDILVIGVKNEI